MVRNTVRVGCLAVLTFGAAVASAAEPEEHGHKAAHGGCLNALGTCENGHAEVTLDAGRLHVWFVGGGTDTARAVRIPDARVTLTLSLAGGKEAKTLTLEATPNELAEERVGDCSHFAGQADWLRGVTAFSARGKVIFRGRQQELRIDYPKGYDPDEGAENEPHEAPPGQAGAKIGADKH